MRMMGMARLVLTLLTALCKGFPDHPEHRSRVVIGGFYSNISDICIGDHVSVADAVWMLPEGGCL